MEETPKARREGLHLDRFAHDLINPVSGLAGAAESLLTQIPPGTTVTDRHYRRLQAMRTAAEDISILVTTMGELSMLSTGERTVLLSSEDAMAMADSARATFTRSTLQPEAVLEVEAKAPGLRVRADTTLLPLCLHHLAHFSMKRSGGRGTVKLVIAPTEGQVTFTFSDANPGLPDEIKRGMDKVRPRTAPLGIRLAFVRLAAIAQGGIAYVEPDPTTGGYAFVVALPSK